MITTPRSPIIASPRRSSSPCDDASVGPDPAAPVTFALVGCGQVARKHANALYSGRLGARLAAVCDSNLERAKAFAADYSTLAFPSINEMLRNARTDVVAITTPSGLHREHVLQVVELGARNVVVEKPMALTIEDAEEMVASCARADARLFVVKQNRYNRALRALHEALRVDRFGSLVSVSARVRWSRGDDYYSAGAWRGTWAMDGGVLANQAVHHVDLLQWLIGDIESVFVFGTRRRASIEAEDTAVCALRFANGVLATLEASTAGGKEDSEAAICVIGQQGAVDIGGFSMDRVLKWRFATALPEDEFVREQYRENSGFPPAHEAYLRDVVASVRNGTPPPVDGAQGLRAVRTLCALYESMVSGRAVDVTSVRSTQSPLGGKMPLPSVLTTAA
jgi:predicted dehydrogenase